MDNKVKKIGELVCEFIASNDPLAIALRNIINNSHKEETGNISLEDCIDNCDLMKVLHVSQRTLQTMRSNGTIPYSKVRNKVYYDKNEIKDMLKANRIQKRGSCND